MKCQAIGCNNEANKTIEYDLKNGEKQELQVCSDHQDINDDITLTANYKIKQ